ncbi:DUF4369 domain-containing protein [Paenimyroides tangerinum]|uniref:DUF4369 domain-containing protein n=1 Tax=Paenimyroides tangerinum TaxID=2488728 RepID=A0A3P3WK22_9FLAO|nr:DUF4369 domain-containing protein [Paenimyroides tangerinum]RRJ93213.1 DUF4369 domain-containing protein [Paenimyroides tangerinum]
MKKFLFLTAIAFSVISCSKDSGNLNLTGEVKGLKQGTIYIKTAKENGIVTLDSIVFDGKSQFKTNLNIEEPQVLYLSLNRGVSQSQDKNLMFFAEPGEMKITTSLERFYGDAKIEGSKNQELFDKYLASKRNLTNRQNDLIKDQMLYSKSGFQNKADSLEKAIQSTTKRIYLNAVNFALKNKDKEVAPYVAITEIAPISNKYLDTIQKSIPDNIAKSLYGKALIEMNK